MAGVWYVKRGEKQAGPLSAQKLRELANAGKIKPTDMVRKGTAGPFRPASQLKGVFPAAATVSKPPQPARAQTALEDVADVADEDYGEPLPPPRRKTGAKKKTSSKKKSKSRKKSRRQSAGLSEPVLLMLWILGGAIGGGLGAVGWMLIVKATEHEIAYVAIGVGLLAGLGVRVFASQYEGPVPGGVGAVMGCLGIMLGKSLAANALGFAVGDTFSPYDVIWFGAATVTAWRVGYGGISDD